MGDNDAETLANVTSADYDYDDESFDSITSDAKASTLAIYIYQC